MAKVLGISLFLIVCCLFLSERCQGDRCSGYFYVTTEFVDLTTTAYVSECASSDVDLLYITIIFYGYNRRTGIPARVDEFSPITDGGAYVSSYPALTGTAAGLTWDITTNNTCLTMSDNTLTSVKCTYILKLTGFNSTYYLDYESLTPSNDTIEVYPIVYRNTSGGCTWTSSTTISVVIQNCNEAPSIDSPVTGSTFNISEYDGVSDQTSYSGHITLINCSDPDVNNVTYGTVTLSVSAVYRPNSGNLTETTEAFYIGNNTFFGSNGEISSLNWDPNLCSNVSGCFEIFQANRDSSTYAEYTVMITATDSDGLNTTNAVTVRVTAYVPTPAWDNMPGNCSIAEQVSGPLQIYQIHMTILNNNSLDYNTSISISAVDSFTSITYFELDSSCYPSPSNSSILCAGLNLTSSVVNGTFDFLAATFHNITILGILTPSTASGLSAVTISSSVIVHIDGVNRQPNLTLYSDTVTVMESSVADTCIYDLAPLVVDPNGDTVFTASIVDITQTGNNNMWLLSGLNICYSGGAGKSVGTCCNQIFTETISPYVIKVEVQDQHGTPAPSSTFTLTVSISNSTTTSTTTAATTTTGTTTNTMTTSTSTTTTNTATSSVTGSTVVILASGGLSSAAIGGIVGAIGGALILAGIAFLLAKYLQKKAKKKGMMRVMKRYRR